ncbi:MAG: glutathione S-transferase [Proteobacteria bacterium]|nr:glutathione S-transferase [Pseudomonadota bacterium]
MKLYESKMAPNPRRVRIFLAEKGIEMECVEMDLQKGDNLSDEYRKKNMFAKVPTLELDDGTCIAETIAICRYFEELQPEPCLFGGTPLEKATIEMWQRRIELYLLVPISDAFRNLTGFFADRETTVKEWGEVSFKKAENCLQLLDEHLAGNTFMAGDQFSVADISALCAIDFGGFINLKIADTQKNLARWHGEVSGRPSTQA